MPHGAASAGGHASPRPLPSSVLPLSIAGWVLGAALTAAVAGASSLAFGVHSRPGHLLLGTVDVCVALLLGYLLAGRVRRTRRLQDLLLAQGLLLLAVAGTPGIWAALHDSAPDRLQVWAAVATRVTAALLIVTGSLIGGARRLPPRSWPAAVPAAAWALLLVVLWWEREGLAPPLPTNPPASATDPVITGHPLLLAAQLVGATCFAVASLAFTHQARHRRDALVTWLGPACALAAFARVNYFLFPSVYSDWLYSGDLLRTASYAVLLVGAAREISQHWSGWAVATVLEDRRRLARELHDGVVQELGYIRAVAGGAVPGEDERSALLESCDRAIDEARAAVDALGRSPEEPLGFVLHRAARQVAERYGGRVLVDLDDSVRVVHPQRHALVRITREAVSNALRHGRADAVCVRLARVGEEVRLEIRDDGRGFDPSATQRSTGYGLTSMRERAVALPGSFEIESAAGRGTAVVVTWAEATAQRHAARRVLPGGPLGGIRAGADEDEGMAG